MFATAVINSFAFAVFAHQHGDELSIAAIRLGVNDLKSSVEFYSKHLGWESAGNFSSLQYAMLENHGVMLVLTPVQSAVSIGEQHCHTRINFAVDDLDETMMNMKAAGVRFIAEKRSAVGRYATFLDPSGNQHNIKQLDQPDEPIDSPRVYDVGISVTDMTKAADFYANVLGFEELTRKYYPPVVPMKQQGCTFFILSEDAKHSAPYKYGESAHAGLAFAVQDIDESIKQLHDKGVRFLQDKVQSAGNVRYIAFADPFGNVHELITHTNEDSEQAEPAPAPSHAPKVADLAWMTGTWVRQEHGSHLEEIWTAPQDGAMLGTFRWHRDGKPWMYELMSIQEEDGTLVFRLRHFDAKFTPWEKREPLKYTFEIASENEVTFEKAMKDEPGHTHPQRIVFRHDPEGNTYSVKLVPAEQGKEAHEFVFTHAKSQ
jgi:predicted enzyme related to lactoylglutathione lyase